MATIQQQKEDEDPQNASGPTTVAGSGGAGSGGASGPAGSASPVQQNQAPQANQGYTDVASYLNANQQGSQQLGQKVASNLTNKYNETKTGLDNSYNEFSGKVAGGYVPENSDLINQVAANPTGAANDSNTLSQFQKQLNDSYTGPSSWGDFGTQQGKVNEANQYGNLSKTPGGLNVYTQEVEGQTGGPQSQGINQLDTLLLGGDSGAMGQVQNAADPYKSLNDYINSQNMAGGQAVNAAASAAQNASQHALNAFTGDQGVLTNLNTSINNNASNQQNQAQDQLSALNANIGNIYGGQAVQADPTNVQTYGGGTTPWFNTTNYSVGDLSPDSMAALGIDQNQWNTLAQAMQGAGSSEYRGGHNFGVMSPTSQIDLNQWLTQLDPGNITAATTASPEQYAQMAAIQQLLGDKTPQGGAINPALASLAGTAPKSLVNFDYQGALDSANQTGSSQKDAAQRMADMLSSNADLSHAQSQHGGMWNTVKNTFSKPGNLLFGHMNPKEVLQTIKNASQGKVPTGDNPLPNAHDTKKLGLK